MRAALPRCPEFSGHSSQYWVDLIIYYIYIYRGTWGNNCRVFKGLSFGRISFKVGPLCMGLISDQFRCTGFRYNLAIPLAFGTNTKLLHNSADLSNPSGIIMLRFVAFLTLPGMALEVHMSCISAVPGKVFCLVLAAKNVPSKHPIPLNTPSKSICIGCVASVPTWGTILFSHKIWRCSKRVNKVYFQLFFLSLL